MILCAVLSLLGVAHSARFVTYVGQAGPGWGNPGTNEAFLEYIGVPGYSSLVGSNGYNVINFAFWVSNSANGGAAVNGAAFDWQNILNRITSTSLRQTLTDKTSPTAAELRAGIKALYAADGVELCISAFGGADHPMDNGANAETTAVALAAYASDYDYDCVDVDWEEAINGYFGATAGGETWLCSLTNKLRSELPSSMAISHAPQAPYFMGSTGNQYPNGGYATVHKNCGSNIDWYNVQFYNQGSSTYDTYATLFESSNGWSGNTAVYEIMDGDGPQNVQVDADKIVVGKHTVGDGSTFVSGATLKSIFNSALSAGRWDAGFMTWQFYREVISSDPLIGYVRGANWPASQPTAPTTPRPTDPPVPTVQPTPAPIASVSGNIQIENFGAASGKWYYACNVLNSRMSVSAVEIYMSNGAWFSCTWPDAGFAWQCGVSSTISVPLSVRVTASNGDVITGTSVVTSFSEGATFDIGSNFGDSNSGPLPTPQPTTKAPVTPSPVSVATPSPVSSGGDGITVTSRDGSSAWWFTVSISGVPSGITLDSVQMRSTGSTTWVLGAYKPWSGGYYEFSNNTPYTAPLSFKFTASNGQTLTATDLLSSYAAGTSGTMTQGFSSAYTNEDDEADETGDGDDNGSTMSWAEWAVLAMGAVLVLVAIVALCVYVRRKRSRTVQYFDDAEIDAKSEGAQDALPQTTAGAKAVQMEEVAMNSAAVV